ncbi:GNAT family N-acetyltransferase [Shewanella nanhaiensis]|uniref:GNAT family N-acetyltransferase n=1 Tax=Shewanella nanhaiensis TaxID=2864872 RepID=A0ABS7EAA0_9GAMM|nr:GNAT family N-acetyltransferase [Shewanella nanhaiensis]MBW8186609.1 GNAT family N-acetyltransferase [Shewanella nanhaiensis]
MIEALEQEHFEDVIALGNKVHGDGYLDLRSMQSLYQKGIKDEINANFVAVLNDELVGFRLTYAPGNWQPDSWCLPDAWGVEPEKVCYFKCNTVAEEHRGEGIGGKLLQASIAATKHQGAKAGISHLWKDSPNNSAVNYFTKAGGVLIKEYPNRWNNTKEHPDYICILCGPECHCTACEMILIFK